MPENSTARLTELTRRLVQWRQAFVVLYDGGSILSIASYANIDEARGAAEQLAGESE